MLPKEVNNIVETNKKK